jgi:hypothetical protein
MAPGTSPWTPPRPGDPQQSEEIRAAFKAHLAAINAYWTPERQAADLEQRKQWWVETHAAEALDPTLRWRRFAERAATEAAVFERLVPPEGSAEPRDVTEPTFRPVYDPYTLGPWVICGCPA